MDILGNQHTSNGLTNMQILWHSFQIETFLEFQLSICLFKRQQTVTSSAKTGVSPRMISPTVTLRCQMILTSSNLPLQS